MCKSSRILLGVIGFIFLFIFSWQTGIVSAAEHSLDELDIHVFVKADGSAVITERRVANLSEGTENYIVIENLGKSTIKDFTVTEDGRLYDFKRNWDIDASRESKAFQNGIIETSGGYELAWGIGDYGRHEYVLEYTVTDFIKQLNDAQMIFWRFVNDQTNIPPKQVRIEIESDKAFSDADEGIWAFGHSGDIHFLNDSIVLETDRAMTREEYVTILVRLEDGTFQTNDLVKDSFESVQEQAFQGSDYGLTNNDGGLSNKTFTGFGAGFLAIAGIFMALFIPVIIIIGVLIILLLSKRNQTLHITPSAFKRQYKEEYYRDYPYKGNMLDGYYLIYSLGLGTFERTLTALILKWIYEDRLIPNDDTKGVIFKKDTISLSIINDGADLTGLERQMFRYLVAAAGDDQILQQKEFNRWGKNNYQLIESWEKSLREQSAKKLMDEGYVFEYEYKKWIIKYKMYDFTEEGKGAQKHAYQFVNYLFDYSLLNEHEAINVKLWDELMIWAAYVGCSKVVSDQLGKLEPTYDQQSKYDMNTIVYTQSFSKSFYSTVQSTAESRSSGSGGSSSSGGGGGSFGGGSGGGTR